MLKNFDDLTIADDYIFCTVMQDVNLCKDLLSLVLKNKIGAIVKVHAQQSITTHIASKGIRLDMMIEDDTGKLYDIEMQTTDQKNLAKRMRYYQCAIDNSALNKGSDYNDLPDTFIIFFCTFDYLNGGKPIYTIKPTCIEMQQGMDAADIEQNQCVDRRSKRARQKCAQMSSFDDGTVKIIVNSAAADHAEAELRDFLWYMNGKTPHTDFTKAIEKKVAETKEDEEKRREYMLIQSFEMDARRAGMHEGIAQGVIQGIAQGEAKGMRQKAIETAKLMIAHNYPIAEICLMTGLTKEDVETMGNG